MEQLLWMLALFLFFIFLSIWLGLSEGRGWVKCSEFLWLLLHSQSPFPLLCSSLLLWKFIPCLCHQSNHSFLEWIDDTIPFWSVWCDACCKNALGRALVAGPERCSFFSALHWWGCIWSAVSGSEPTSTRKTWTYWGKSSMGCKDV